MKESDLNTIIKNSIIEDGGNAFKIPDPQGMYAVSTTQRPFDGFGILHGKPIYWEGKFQKNQNAFNLSRIEDHQIVELSKYQSLCDCYSVIILGTYEPRKYFDIYLFDINTIKELQSQGKKSVLKKELELLREHGCYLSVKKKLVSFSDIVTITNKTETLLNRKGALLQELE